MSISPDIVFIGLTITSSWGNGHATTYRSLIKALNSHGHTVLFLEKDVPWYKNNRDFTEADYARIDFYSSFDELKCKFTNVIKNAEIVIVGSYVPDGINIGDWVTKTAHGLTAFYDIDTPVTLANIKKGSCTYITKELISRYNMYLSFAGGPVPSLLENVYGSPFARPLFCSVDPDIYFPEEHQISYDLGYMGTYCDDRQSALEHLLFEPSQMFIDGNFIVAGPMYPQHLFWPKNVMHTNHIAPAHHRQFYCSQRFTLNLTRADMIATGYAPSVRLFEAAACGTPVISDYWNGLEELFSFNDEILISKGAGDTLQFLTAIPDHERKQIGINARNKIMKYHTANQRAQELDFYIYEMRRRRKVFYSLHYNVQTTSYLQAE